MQAITSQISSVKQQCKEFFVLKQKGIIPDLSKFKNLMGSSFFTENVLKTKEYLYWFNAVADKNKDGFIPFGSITFRDEVVKYINSLSQYIRNNQSVQNIIKKCLNSDDYYLNKEYLDELSTITDRKIFEDCFENKSNKIQKHNLEAIQLASKLMSHFHYHPAEYLNKDCLVSYDGKIQKDMLELLFKSKNFIKPEILKFANIYGNINKELIPFGQKLYDSLAEVGDLLAKKDIISPIMIQIRDSVVEDGVINYNLLDKTLKEIEKEITSGGIKNSFTLNHILSNKLKTELGIVSDNLDNIETIINKESRLFDKLQKHLACKYHSDNEVIGILKNNSDASPEEVYQFLYKTTSDLKTKKYLAREFSENLDGNEIKKLIIEKLGGDDNAIRIYDTWYNDEKYGYKKAYSDYYNNLYEKTKSLMTIVKQSPNVAPWAFLNKVKALGVEPTLGKLPKEYGNINDFRLLIKELIKIDKDTNNRYFKKKYPYYKEIQYYITIDGKKFEVEKLRGGMSAKTKYKVTPENGDTYIIKFNEYDAIGNTWRSTQIRENQAMRADSPYLDAIVDFYLKANGCKNAADIKFFDYTSKAVVYKVTKGEKSDFENNMFNNLYTFNSSKLAADIRRLGIILNDVNDGNFLKDSKGRNVLIDTGHAEYNHPFRPMVMGKHISLSNLCGRDLK